MNDNMYDDDMHDDTNYEGDEEEFLLFEAIEGIQGRLNYHMKYVTLPNSKTREEEEVTGERSSYYMTDRERVYHAGCINGILDSVAHFSNYLEEPLIPDLILAEFDEREIQNMDDDVYGSLVFMKRGIIDAISKKGEDTWGPKTWITGPDSPWHQAAKLLEKAGYEVSYEETEYENSEGKIKTSLAINIEIDKLDIYDVLHAIA